MSGRRLRNASRPKQPRKKVQSENEVDRSNSSRDEDLCMEINLSDISDDLQCPICLGVLRKTKIVMQCLHRFCAECIEKSIRLCKNECPICCEHYPGGCKLGDDSIYDDLISIIHPDIDKYEEESLRECVEEMERKQKARATAGAFARRRKIMRNASEDEKTEAEPNKALEESAALHGDADGTAHQNIPDI